MSPTSSISFLETRAVGLLSQAKLWLIPKPVAFPYICTHVYNKAERRENRGVREGSISGSHVLDPVLQSRVPPSLRLRPISPGCHVIPFLTGVLQSLHQLLHGRSNGLSKILGSTR